MEEQDKVVMRKMHVQLVRELDTTGLLLDYLYQENILAEDDVEKIKAKKTSKKRAEKLLKILKKRRGGLKMLIKGLIHTKIQDFLGYEILKKVTWSEKDKETFDLELDEQIDEQQKIKTELEAAKRKIRQLEMMIDERQKIKTELEAAKRRIQLLERKLKELQKEELQRNQSNFSGLLKFFRRSKERRDKPRGKNLHSIPCNLEGGHYEDFPVLARPRLQDTFADPFEVPRTRRSTYYSPIDWCYDLYDSKSSEQQSTTLDHHQGHARKRKGGDQVFEVVPYSAQLASELEMPL